MCKHDWVVIVNEYEKSPHQKGIDARYHTKVSDMDIRYYLGKKIIILQCRICGKLDKTIESV